MEKLQFYLIFFINNYFRKENKKTFKLSRPNKNLHILYS